MISTPCIWNCWMCRNACWWWICLCLWCCCYHDVRWGTWSVISSPDPFYSPLTAVGVPDAWFPQRRRDRHEECWCTPPCRPQTVQGKTFKFSKTIPGNYCNIFSLKGCKVLPFWCCHRCQWGKQRSRHIWRSGVCNKGHLGTRCCHYSRGSSSMPCWSQWSCCQNKRLDLQEKS